MLLNIGILAVLGFLNPLCQGQEYVLEDPERSFISHPQKFRDFSIPFHQHAEFEGVGVQPDFYQSRDLQTSDLPVHLQQTLPQYRPHTLKTVPKNNYQRKILNVPNTSEPFNDYINPSTHRTHLLPNENFQNSLQLDTVQQQKATNDPLVFQRFRSSNLYESNNNKFDRDQKVIRSAQNLPFNSIPDKKSVPNTYSNLLDLRELNKENSKQSVQDTKNIQTADDYSIEDDSFYTESNPNEKSEDNSSDKENQNYIDDEEYDEDYLEDEENSKENSDYEVGESEEAKNETYEVLTLKPMVTTQENTFKDFVDTEFMDTTTQEPASSEIQTQLPVSIFSSGKNITNTEIDDFPEFVVSVVTSKTIVNNTIISPVTITQLTTSSPIESPVSPKDETSTDSWIVVASVQTSKSISGARYLPSSIVEQHNINKSLNGADDNVKTFEDKNWSVEITTPEIISTNSKSSTKFKTSTESLIDKLDRVQSDLSSGLLTGGFKNDNIAVIDENTPVKMDTITPVKPTSLPSTTTKQPYPQVNIRKFNAGNRSFKPKPKENLPTIRSKPLFTATTKSSSQSNISKEQVIKDSIFNNAKPVDAISALLPPGYKVPIFEENNVSKILKNTKVVKDISALLPSGYTPSESISTEKSLSSILAKAKPVEDISDLLPPGFKPSKLSSSENSISNIFAKAQPLENISSLLPPGFKQISEGSNKSKDSSKNVKSEENDISKIHFNSKPITDLSSLLPPDYKLQKQVPTEKSVNNILAKAKPVADISSLLPPGYRGANSKGYKGTPSPLEVASQVVPNNLLPAGYDMDNKNSKMFESLSPPFNNIPVKDMNSSTTAKPKEVKLVFPSRPGAGSRKSSRLTTSKSVNEPVNKPIVPTIQKGWPIRSSTEFTGWPTPSTTPISIEKLLEAARTAITSTSTSMPTTVSSTTTTTKPTTTSPKPTTPGICIGECDLAGTIKLIGGAKWVPELLDRNTKEWQILANDVQSELESIYSNSLVLKDWYRKIRIDGFSEGSILVDYLVELSEVGKKVDTQEIKHLFHESLSETIRNNSNREGKSLNETKSINRISLGHFELDPKFTDFVVIPKHAYPTVSYSEDNIMLPQWAIAVIVIGLASLLFVIIFGVTVLINRHKNSKKTPAPLTEDMLNELNKNHMGGFENYGVDDFYNLEDVWSDKPYEQKSHKKRTNDSIYDNSMSNLYDSWRSQWNGTYDNRHDGSLNNSIQHGEYIASRRPKYDTDF